MSRLTKIGLALGGGFARGMAHVGVLRVFEREKIPVHAIAGCSAGAIAAAAFASGASSEEIERAALSMQPSDIADANSMTKFLSRLLKKFDFSEMNVPLAIVASDLTAAAPVVFKDRGDVILPIQASCAYPGMFAPVRYMNHCLVDGMVAMDVPAAPLRRMGATHVISVVLPRPSEPVDPMSMASIVQRSFQIMTARTESHWRRSSDLVISPDVKDIPSNGFHSALEAIEAGERAAEAAISQIKKRLELPAAA